ncbi:MAG: MopE-related protein [Myxococcota bacterium]
MARVLIALAFVYLAGCDGEAPGDKADDTAAAVKDEDGDGWNASEDCDESDPAVNPDAVEACDGVDNDCDDTIDEGVTTTFWPDGDDDGYGDADTPMEACSVGEGVVANGEDCDDEDAAISPDADEVCNEVDDDCDGVADDGLGGDWYVDADGDGHGDPDLPSDACELGEGVAETGDDCDDTDASVHPGAVEADCTDPVDYNCDGSVGYDDFDTDGWPACQECDDGNARIRPDANEACNAVDDDCDGEIDEPGADGEERWYWDLDGDGYGDPQASEDVCEPPEALVRDATDCDDTDATLNPGAGEVCDGVDQDCDGAIDEDAVDAPAWYGDADADGYGDPAAALAACEVPAGYLSDGTDCDDADAREFPGADETCDGDDDDCDGDVDEDTAVDAPTWYTDADADGHGDATSPAIACDAPAGTVADATDCDDTDATVSPSSPERCNDVDDDCDGEIDEAGAEGADTFYADADGDGYGDATVTTDSCDAPGGWTADATDCDDGDADTHPAAAETCDGEDDDCDGETDEDSAVDAPTWYGDADGDTFGDPASPYAACTAPAGYVADATDCDDAEATTYPGATERCDGEDDDCDGTADEDDAADAPTWYADADGDAYGSLDAPHAACIVPAGYVADATDCDDAAGTTHPGATEYCDGEDDDCDGTTDEDDAADAATWFRDADADGYGDAASPDVACDAPASYVADATDCDDTSPGVSPAAVEACDGEDDDCDGTVDEADAADAATWYTDADADGYGDPALTTVACDAPVGTVGLAGDCDDGDATVSPAATELCDGEDDDCDGAVDEDSADDAPTWYADADADGYGSATTSTRACAAPSAYVAAAGDCDDADAGANPGEDEACDGDDDDCDGTVDEPGAVDAATWYRDGDADSYGDPSVTTPGCSQPSGYVADASDCDDADATVSPAGTETCDGDDEDCDGTVDEGPVGAPDWYADADGDGYGDATTLVEACDAPAGYVANGDDCGDTDATVSPVGTETCDLVDNDCDGTVDEATAVDASTWYADTDGDGYGTSSSPVVACDQPSNHVSDASDCDDNASSVSPAATETCDDGVDQDCDGTADDGCPVTYTHCGNITSDTIWSGDGDTHVVTCDIAVGGAASPTLTIEDGAIVEFYPAAGLRIAQSNLGRMLVNGATQGVTFTSSSATPAPGDWDLLAFYGNDTGSVIEGATIEYAGAAGYGGIYVYGADLTVVDSVVRDNEGPGFYVHGFGTVAISGTDIVDNETYGVFINGIYGNLAETGGPTFTDNVVSGNGTYPMYVQAEDVEQLDASSSFTGNGTDLIYVLSGTVTGDATWQALDVPYYLAGNLTLGATAGPVMTIEDGAELRFAASAAFNVATSNPGRLVVNAPTEGVRFTSVSASPAAGDWDGIYIGIDDLGTSIEGAIVEYAGANGYGGFYLWETEGTAPFVEIADSTITENLYDGIYVTGNSTVVLRDNTITNNTRRGVYMGGSAELYTDPTAASFDGNVVSGNGDVPLYIDGDEVGEIGTGNTLSGNGTDQVYVTAATIAEDATWPALDVYYRIAGDLQVYGSVQPKLTISDGADLRFDTAAGIFVGLYGDGELVVDGTSAGVYLGPSTTSPIPGDWDGLAFYGNDQGSVVEGATIAYAGNNGYGGIYCTNCDNEGGGVSIRDTTVSDSEFAGIYVTSGGRVELVGVTAQDNTTWGVYFSSNSSLVGLTTSSGWLENTMTGNGTYPLALQVSDVGYVDAASVYSGNGTDWVYVYAGDVSSSATWPTIDADYYLAGDVYVRNSVSAPTLTVSAGNTLRFALNAGLLVGTTTGGELVATGSVTDPVTFTSAQTAPIAGDWDGITLGIYDRGSTLDYTVVEYGGSNLYGDVYVNQNNLPSITNSTMRYSSKYGIYRRSCSPTVSGITYASNTSGDLY